MLATFASYSSLEQPNVLNLSYAQLELDHGYIRATTPFHSIYDISSRNADGWGAVTSDQYPAAKAIRTYWESKASSHEVGDTVEVRGVTLLTAPLDRCTAYS